MTRFLLVAMLILLGPASVTAQSTASVLADSDIWSAHLLQRPVEVEGRDWLGLLLVDGESRLEPVAARWNGSVLFGDSVFELDVTPELTPDAVPYLLLAEVPGIRAGDAPTVLETEASLWTEERRLEIALGDDSYELELSASDPMLCDAAVTLTLGTATQTLYPPGNDAFSCDEPHFSVQWAGDLDGDGRLDLVTTFSPKYSYFPRRLWLSSAASAGELVGLVATTELAAA